MRSHSTPCWHAAVDTRWVGRLLAELDQRGLEAFAGIPSDITDAPDGRAHVVAREGLTPAVVARAPVRALCGRTFVSERDPASAELCDDSAGAHDRLEAPAHPGARRSGASSANRCDV